MPDRAAQWAERCRVRRVPAANRAQEGAGPRALRGGRREALRRRSSTIQFDGTRRLVEPITTSALDARVRVLASPDTLRAPAPRQGGGHPPPPGQPSELERMSEAGQLMMGGGTWMTFDSPTGLITTATSTAGMSARRTRLECACLPLIRFTTRRRYCRTDRSAQRCLARSGRRDVNPS